jgi:hypothetical protein
MLACRGCSETSIYERTVFDERIPDPDYERPVTHEVFKPPRTWRRPPSWLDELERIDPDLVYLLREVYSAANETQSRLLSMGVRAALDRVMTKILNGDAGAFAAKLSNMVDAGHITDTQRSNLDIVIDAGSAASHRGYRPPRELLEQMLEVMEGIIRDHYITGPMLRHAATLIPPRPPRR